jgi:peptidoglycan/LPS O-acetylase OafA/YrhL
LAWLVIQCLIAIGERAIHREIPSVVSNTFLLGYFQLFFAGILFYKIRIEGWHWIQCVLLGLCILTHGIVHNSLVAAAEALLFAIIFALFVSNRLHFLCNRPLLFLGSISYTLYLIHQNVGYTVIYHLSLVNVPHWACVVLAAGLSLVLASLLTTFVERPALKAIRDKYKQHRIQKEILITRRPATTSSVQ